MLLGCHPPMVILSARHASMGTQASQTTRALSQPTAVVQRIRADPPEAGRVKWNPFSVRHQNLSSVAAMQSSSKARQTAAMVRAREGCITLASRSLDLLRQNLQRLIDREIDAVMQGFMERYFRPAMENIRTNQGPTSVTEEHLNAVCRQILDEAKRMYFPRHSRTNSPANDSSDSETNHAHLSDHFVLGKRKETDGETQTSSSATPKKKAKSTVVRATNSVTGPKPSADWNRKFDPSRLTVDTLFVMGARANKALGFGQTRGRLYMKYPELFKYSGDQNDKVWLAKNGLMPTTGGKAYLMLVQDIVDLLQMEEYRSNPNVSPSSLTGFRVPEFMIEKMKLSVGGTKEETETKKYGAMKTEAAEQTSPKTNVVVTAIEPSSNVPYYPAVTDTSLDLLKNNLTPAVPLTCPLSPPEQVTTHFYTGQPKLSLESNAM